MIETVYLIAIIAALHGNNIQHITKKDFYAFVGAIIHQKILSKDENSTRRYSIYGISNPSNQNNGFKQVE
jgi:hypothetical protein